MPKRKSQLSRHTSQTRAAKLRRKRESSFENSQRLASQRAIDSAARARESSTERSQRLAKHRQHMSDIRARESSIERSQRLTAEAQRQRAYRMRNQSYKSAFSYDRNIDYVQQSLVPIGAMGETCPECFAKKWSSEPNGMCCAADEFILPDIEELPQPIKSLFTGMNNKYRCEPPNANALQSRHPQLMAFTTSTFPTIKTHVKLSNLRPATIKQKIPRPPNAFMLFANDFRRKLAGQYPKESNKDISIRLGIMWKAMNKETKEKYFHHAKEVDAAHKKKYPAIASTSDIQSIEKFHFGW